MTDPRALALVRALLAGTIHGAAADDQLLVALNEIARRAPGMRLRHEGPDGTVALRSDGSLHGLALAWQEEGAEHPVLLRGVALADVARRALHVPQALPGKGPWWDYCAWHWTRRENQRCAECDREAADMLAEAPDGAVTYEDVHFTARATPEQVRAMLRGEGPVRFPWEYAEQEEGGS